MVAGTVHGHLAVGRAALLRPGLFDEGKLRCAQDTPRSGHAECMRRRVFHQVR